MATFPDGCALIFGGSGGIGSGVALTFAECGSDIAVVYRSKPDPAQAAADHAISLGRKGSVHQADVTDAAQLQAAIDEAIATHGRVHSVVWGAGPLVNQRYLAETPMEEWRHAFEVEVHGFFQTATMLIPHMREQGGGSFVTLGSAGHDWWPARDGMSVAVKASNEQLVKGIAKEEGKHKIRANSVLVGVIDAGQMHELTSQGQLDQQWVEETLKLLCLKRWGTPAEIGHACVYFASDEGSYTTGQSISVGGGFGV
ncbi:MAG: SDR family oxidoreductase [Sphingomonadaceae bacterium]|nr:SDR family oxidoreductase [Sphingomonadaceae bacterium]